MSGKTCGPLRTQAQHLRRSFLRTPILTVSGEPFGGVESQNGTCTAALLLTHNPEDLSLSTSTTVRVRSHLTVMGKIHTHSLPLTKPSPVQLDVLQPCIDFLHVGRLEVAFH